MAGQNAKFDNTNRGALWARGDGIKASGDKKPPIMSGVIDVDGVPHSISLWAYDSDDEEVNFALRAALVMLTKAAGGSPSEDEPSGGRPIFKASIQARDGGGKGKTKPAPKAAPSKFDF